MRTSYSFSTSPSVTTWCWSMRWCRSKAIVETPDTIPLVNMETSRQLHVDFRFPVWPNTTVSVILCHLPRWKLMRSP